jgi:(p)ppGpp synthase/HD superfamily hydrolase
MTHLTQPLLTERYALAFAYANRLHAQQLRKGTTVPYISHLMSVSALVLEAGGDEDEAIAALLHDAVEDQGGADTLAEIGRQFGEQVAAWVAACSDTMIQPKPPWRERKEVYLQRLLTMPEAVVRIAIADKLHNARCTLADLQKDGNQVWQRFKTGREGTLWLYRAFLSRCPAGIAPGLLQELQQVIEAIESVSVVPDR